MRKCVYTAFHHTRAQHDFNRACLARFTLCVPPQLPDCHVLSLLSDSTMIVAHFRYFTTKNKKCSYIFLGTLPCGRSPRTHTSINTKKHACSVQLFPQDLLNHQFSKYCCCSVDGFVRCASFPLCASHVCALCIICQHISLFISSILDSILSVNKCSTAAEK